MEVRLYAYTPWSAGRLAFRVKRTVWRQLQTKCPSVFTEDDIEALFEPSQSVEAAVAAVLSQALARIICPVARRGEPAAAIPGGVFNATLSKKPCWSVSGPN